MSLIWSTRECTHAANEPRSAGEATHLARVFAGLRRTLTDACSGAVRRPLNNPVPAAATTSSNAQPPVLYGLYPGLSVPFSVAILSSVG